MNREQIVKQLTGMVGYANVRENELLSEHTSFKVGGPCIAMVNTVTCKLLKAVLAFLKENDIKYFILGNGSNLIVSDEGFDGVVIRLTGEFETLKIDEEQFEGNGLVTAGANILLPKMITFVSRKGFGGMEALHGIPGTVGGALYMNASAYEKSIADYLVEVEVLDVNGEVVRRKKDELNLSYRHSIFMENGDIILFAWFMLPICQRILLYTLIEDYDRRRREKQPLNFPSAGSVFKRPVGHYAGKLIEEAGLKGTKVGGAMVSEKHAGFIVNTGNATAKDVLDLIEIVKKKVYENSGVMLEEEVRIL
ncbi:MAG: UDP-N-acetylmuramate dehydrogenase [Lachnospiraceae bacterium]|nr:UDP-N-acetylmuramate dehydrogenase [Lachnospiraceae bacterium]